MLMDKLKKILNLQQLSLTPIFLMGIVIITLFGLRFIPHPPNLTPVLGLMICSVSFFKEYKTQFGVPLMGMLLSDAVIGFHTLMPVVYGSLFVAGCFGFLLKSKVSFLRLGLASLGSSILFFYFN